MIFRIFFFSLFFVSALSLKAETVQVGLLLGSKSVMAAEAEEIRNGVRLGIEEINNNSQLKYQLQVQEKDSGLNPDKAEELIENLKPQMEGGVNYVIGPQSSAEMLRVADYAKNQQMVLISPSARSDLAGIQNDYIFRTRHSQKQESEFFSKYIFSKLKKEALHSIILDSYAGASHIQLFNPIYSALGGKFGIFEDLYLDRPDYEGFLSRLKSRNGKYVYIVGLSVQAADLMTEAALSDFKLKFFGTADNHSQVIIDRAGQDAEGFTVPYSFDYEDNQKSAWFAQEYQMKFSKMPGYVAANAYDAVSVLSTCLEKVGDNRQAVKSCLYYVKNFDGAGGRFSIDRNGNCRRDLFIKQIVGGRFVKPAI